MLLQDVSSHKTFMAHLPEDGILHSHYHENFKSYIVLSRSLEFQMMDKVTKLCVSD
jgi:hypothetical protein